MPHSNDAPSLTSDQLVLLATHFAVASDIRSLISLATAHAGIISSTALLRILLTYLPETLPPEQYTHLIAALSNNNLSALDDHDATTLDVSSVSGLSPGKAKARVRKLQLLSLAHPLFEDEPLSETEHFVIHRAHRIDAGPGLLDSIPSLVNPFLDTYPELRTWFVSNVLPLLRYEYEYYPGNDRSLGLEEVENAHG